MFHEYERLPCVHRQYHNVLDCIICTFVYHSNFLHLPTEAVPFCGRVSSLELRRRSHVLPDVPPSSILPNKFMHGVCAHHLTTSSSTMLRCRTVNLGAAGGVMGKEICGCGGGRHGHFLCACMSIIV